MFETDFEKFLILSVSDSISKPTDALIFDLPNLFYAYEISA